MGIDKLFEKRKSLIVLSLIVIVVAYFSFLFAPFYFDDFYNIVYNPGLNSLGDALMCRRGGFRPLAYLWFYFDKKLFGLTPFYFRLENIFIHLINFIVVFYVFEKLTKERGERDSFLISISATLFWGLNPINSQSVAYIVQRMNEAATLFVLIGFYFYLNFIENKQKIYLWGVFYSLIIAMGFKETGVLLIPLCLLHYTIFKNAKKGLVFFVSFVIAGFFLVFFVPQFKAILPIDYLLGGTVNDKNFTLIEKFLTSFKVMLDYIIVFIFPIFKNIHLYYSFELEKTFYSIRVIIPFLLMFSLIITGFILIKRDKLLSFLVLSSLMLLFPENSFLPLDIAYQHRMYLPSVFLSLALIIVVFKVINIETIKYVLGSVFLFLIINLFARGIVFSVPQWFYFNELKHAGNNEKIYVNASKNLLENGDLESAYYYLERGIEKFPDNPLLAMNMGLFYAKKGEIDKAIYWYKKAKVKKNPFLKEVYWSLAVLYWKKGDFDKCRKFIKYLKENNFSKTRINLLENKLKLIHSTNAFSE